MSLGQAIIRSKPGVLASGLLVLALLVSGCSQTAETESSMNEPELGDSDVSEQTPPETDSEPEAETEVEQSPTETIELVECGQQDQDQMESTIDSQTASFAEGDFEDAYSYASPSFRANVSLNAFIQIINGSYGPLISSSNLQYSNCVADADFGLGFIDVRFTQSGTEVYALKYTLVASDEGWRVDGAGNLEAIGQGT